MNVIDELIEIFRKFPGVGPRQAERFVYYLLRQKKDYLNKISTLVPALYDRVHICNSCHRFYLDEYKDVAENSDCSICSDSNRHKNILMIVARDVDLLSVEKSGNYNGVYFVMGGLIPVLDKNPYTKVRLEDLNKIVERRFNENSLQEIIIALSANPEGENTTEVIKKEIGEFTKANNIKVSVLGRGLSTGTELEYSDSETIKNALMNRF